VYFKWEITHISQWQPLSCAEKYMCVTRRAVMPWLIFEIRPRVQNKGNGRVGLAPRNEEDLSRINGGYFFDPAGPIVLPLTAQWFP